MIYTYRQRDRHTEIEGRERERESERIIECRQIDSQIDIYIYQSQRGCEKDERGWDRENDTEREREIERKYTKS